MRKTFNEHVSVHTHIRLLKSAHFALHSTEKKFHFLNFFSSVYPYTPTSTRWTWLIFTTRFAEYYIRYPPKKKSIPDFFFYTHPLPNNYDTYHTYCTLWYHTSLPTKSTYHTYLPTWHGTNDTSYCGTIQTCCTRLISFVLKKNFWPEKNILRCIFLWRIRKLEMRKGALHSKK